MATRSPPPLDVLLLLPLLLFTGASSDSIAVSFPFNSSLSLPFNPRPLLPTPPRDLRSPHRLQTFLGEVGRALTAKEQWDPESAIRLADLDGRGARAGVAQRYEFHARVGKTSLILKFYEAVDWTKADGAVVESGSDLVAGDGVAGTRPAVRALELVGPLELRVGTDGGDSDRISLHFPAINVTHGGLRQILVGHGIRIKIESAERISLVHPYDIGLSLNGSLTSHIEEHDIIHYLGNPSCAPRLSVHVEGPAYVSSYSTSDSVDSIEATFKADDIVELLPEKCYINGHVKQISSCSFCFVSSRLGMLDKVLKGFLTNTVFQNTSIRFVKVKITSATLIKFRLQLERDIITENNANSEKIPEWKQKPKVEQIWLQAMARVEGERRLKPVSVKKLKRPYIISDSISLSSLLQNVSFTKLPPFVVPPEALTLDVKW